MKSITLDQILTDLREGEVTFEFEKMNGEPRYMIGTLNADILPTTKDSEVAKSRLAEKLEKGEEITSLAVFEASINDWRSFRLENLTHWNGEDVKYAGS